MQLDSIFQTPPELIVTHITTIIVLALLPSFTRPLIVPQTRKPSRIRSSPRQNLKS